MNTNTCIPRKVPHRRKDKLVVNGNNYKNYSKLEKKWPDIYIEIEKLKDDKVNNFIDIISKKYKINKETLRKRYKKWIRLNKTCNDDKRGQQNKKFTDSEEKDLYECIVNVFINGKLYFDDECLKYIALAKWKEIYNTEDFKASNGWIYYFKYRWKLSTQRSKNTKVSDKINDEDVKNYVSLCVNLFKEYRNSNIFNMDETHWKITNKNINVIGIIGSENRPVICSNPKEGFTSIFIISLDGNMSKPVIILKGKTARCLKKIKGNCDKIRKKFSNSGWVTEEIIKSIFDDINVAVNNEKSILILDKYPVHTTDNVKGYAESKNISLIYVPTGRTGQNQPLDVGVNGPLKMAVQKIEKHEYINDPFYKPNINDSIGYLLESINNFKRENIINSFNIACGNDKT